MLENQQLDEFKDLTDVELIRLFKNGEQIAFQQLAVRYIFVIKNKSSDLYTAGIEPDDLMQEGFLALSSAVDSFDENGEASFRTYAGVCIRNRLLSAVRSAKSKKNKINTVSVSDEDVQNVPMQSEKEPENSVIIKEDFLSLIGYIEKTLSKTEMEVLSMYVDGKSYEEISKLLGISVKSCNNAMQRVRRKLRLKN